MLASEFIAQFQAFVDKEGDFPFAVDAHFGYYSDLWFTIEELADLGGREFVIPEAEDSPVTPVITLQLGSRADV